MRTNQIEKVIPDGENCIDSMVLIVDKKNQKSYQTKYICPFYNEEKKQCWYIKKEIINWKKVCEINDDNLIDIPDDLQIPSII